MGEVWNLDGDLFARQPEKPVVQVHAHALSGARLRPWPIGRWSANSAGRLVSTTDEASMLLENHRFPADYVECLRDVAARDFLVHVGLPSNFIIFRAREAAGGPERIQDRMLLMLGRERDDGVEGTYYVDCDTTEVVWFDDDACLLHVSASPRLFADCLAAFNEIVYAPGVGDVDAGVIADRLKAAINAIDPTTIGSGSGFWSSLIFDVSVGDYTHDHEG